MIAPFDDAIGYTAPEITEREAIALLHELYPQATIEPLPGNPSMMGWHLFKVFDHGCDGIPVVFLVDKDGSVIELDNNVPLVEATL